MTNSTIAFALRSPGYVITLGFPFLPEGIKSFTVGTPCCTHNEFPSVRLRDGLFRIEIVDGRERIFRADMIDEARARARTHTHTLCVCALAPGGDGKHTRRRWRAHTNHIYKASVTLMGLLSSPCRAATSRFLSVSTAAM